MFNLSKELLNEVKAAIVFHSEPQVALNGPQIYNACTQCSASCTQNCTFSCKGGCKGGCTRSCKGSSR